jgi:hypothetical protein
MATDGKDLTLNGDGKGAHACSACHGTQGEGVSETCHYRMTGGLAVRLLMAQRGHAVSTLFKLARAGAPVD